MPKTTIATLLTFFMVSLLVGCNSKTDSETKKSPEESSEVAKASGAPETDAATQPNALPGDDASAKEVCECFTRLLKNGERTLAEQLLTKRAIAAVVDAGLELEPMGSEDSKVEMGDAMYASNQGKVAQVPCTITEKDGADQKLTWMMRKGDNGWRVAGLIVYDGTKPDFLSLENRADVRSIMGTVDADVSDPKAADVRLVSATDDE